MTAETQKPEALNGPEVQNVQLAAACPLSRKCSTCGHAGHNSRTCLESRDTPASGSQDTVDAQFAQALSNRQPLHDKARDNDDGAASDESAGASHREARKKGIPWTEEEHKAFLLGLQRLGKGDWRGISRHFVQSRSPTQVASHAQKYFIRQTVAGKRKRRTSLFDLVPDKQQETSHVPAPKHESAPSIQPRVETQQACQPTFPMPPGMEAFAMAMWFQSMMVQQGPLAWMQALCGQTKPPVGALNSALGQNQSMLPPLSMVPQMNFAGEGQQPGLSGQALAAACMMQQQQQQQFAAALAMGQIPFHPQMNTQALTGADNFDVASLAAMQQQEEKHQLQSHDPVVKKNSGQITGPAVESSLMGRKRPRISEEPSAADSGKAEASFETFGHGELVRPKAQKAQPSKCFGEMPSYMLGNTDVPSRFESGSAESLDTDGPHSQRWASSARPTLEFSGSSNTGNKRSRAVENGTDEQSAIICGKPTSTSTPNTEPASSRLSAKSSVSEFKSFDLDRNGLSASALKTGQPAAGSA